MKTIFVIGSANTDMVIKMDRLPKPGETILGGSFLMNAGGKGANQAVAASRMGGNVTFIAKIGNDIFGKQTTANLKNENIKTDFVFVDEESSSGTALIMVNSEGENCIAVAPGANAKLSPTDIDMVSSLDTADVILIQLEIPMQTIVTIAQRAKQLGKRVILNPAPAQFLPDKLFANLFLITPNETEASLMTGVKVIDEDSAAKAATFFLAKGVENVIITMGKEGAYFQNKYSKMKIAAPVVKAVDTTAAGDTFSGSIAVALTENMEWESAIKFAIQAASISVTRMGAQSSIPYRKDIQTMEN
ncbi:MAG: ribokinase [Cyclobacteriaceae bacterium]|nr:ribokinase [Cyclobacteriaceae bacterium]